MIDLAGKWLIRLEKDEHERMAPPVSEGEIDLPGTLQTAGYGYPVTLETEWVSGLHNPFWYEREEYRYGGNESLPFSHQLGQDAPESGFEEIEPEGAGRIACRVPFLAQPRRHFVGTASYERKFEVRQPGKEWTLRMELARWRSRVYIDEKFVGEDCSLCAAHEIYCGLLEPGEHSVRVELYTGMQYPYRPDGHGVSDGLGAAWNGMVGEIVLLSGEELAAREREKEDYAAAHPRTIEVRDGRFVVDGVPEYFRGTHFGGDYPLTGYPVTDIAWWRKLMGTVKEWGINWIRCHSYCPPEAAFLAADEAGVFLQPECGMWNYFDDKDAAGMVFVLKRETVKILKEFGHHPSFVLFSPSNEPAGEWYRSLREWVRFARDTDISLGYQGRRLYTAQSGWFYDVPPAQIEGTDYIYFHRSAYGPYPGGTVRNEPGWWGRDYNPSLKGCKKPVICHEMGQWCAYPDYERLIPKFTGFMRPGNFEVFRESARENGLLSLAEDFAHCSGRNQVRLLKEEMEANRRTDALQGFELLDLHDYLGQGAALVGVLDAFWERKGYVEPEEFREFCDETVLLIRLPSYVYRSEETLDTPVIVSHYGRKELSGQTLFWRLVSGEGEDIGRGSIDIPRVSLGMNREIGRICQPLFSVKENSALRLELTLEPCGVRNHWEITVFAGDREAATPTDSGRVFYTKDFAEAVRALQRGEAVLYTPYLSDLDYDCPPLSYKNTFWNAQMGPKWSRGLGISVREAHPIFRYFPTGHDGGWQWADILSHARGFCLDEMSEGIMPVVRAIDEWNRNLPQSLILEAKVQEGRLLLVSADLEGSFEERPAAYTLKNALLRYLAEGEYAAAPEISMEQIASHIRSLAMSREWIEDISWKGVSRVGPGGVEALFDPNPNTFCALEGKSFPLQVTLHLRPESDRRGEMGRIRGLTYLPVQSDRMFEGCIREYQIHGLCRGEWVLLDKGLFRNSLRPQNIWFPKQIGLSSGSDAALEELSQIRLTVISCYGQGERISWEAGPKGWKRKKENSLPMAQFAALSLICEGGDIHSDELFWKRKNRSNTREIEA